MPETSGTLEKLDRKAFEDLYGSHIVRDFPVAERRPLHSIRSLYKKGNYAGIALKKDGALQAYAAFLHDASIGGVLLDYFAVERGLRGGGIGSGFLRRLRGLWDGKAGIIIESELPEQARAPGERATRDRRLAFYVRAGAALSPARWRAFGVDYNILWLPIRRALEEADPASDIRALYGLSLPKAVLSRATKVYGGTGEGRDGD
ncbi:MAG: hypothetical protein LBL83_12960 [Clostridiales bacterium]|jgi:hypothetical protein|nr:hypothetical protein [Clostridiales bacterium]